MLPYHQVQQPQLQNDLVARIAALEKKIEMNVPTRVVKHEANSGVKREANSSGEPGAKPNLFHSFFG